MQCAGDDGELMMRGEAFLCLHCLQENGRLQKQLTSAGCNTCVFIDCLQVSDYYVAQSKAVHHGVREAACACIAELAEKVQQAPTTSTPDA